MKRHFSKKRREIRKLDEENSELRKEKLMIEARKNVEINNFKRSFS